MKSKIFIPQQAKKIISMLKENGFDAYFVGGCVRDYILNIPPSDWDITSSALPDEVISIFFGYKVIKTGIKHGTVTVLVDSIPFEVTTFRVEADYTDFRRPNTVNFVRNLKEDLSRRDFTINAMAMNRDENIIDYFSGMKDLESRIIKTVGNPEERFSEDALRILRMYRFAARFDFDIEEKTLNAAQNLSGNLAYISKERINAELSGIIKTDKPAKTLQIMYEAGIIENVFSKTKYSRNPKKSIDFSLIDKVFKKNYYVRLAIFYNMLIDVTDLKEFMKEMKYSNYDINIVYNIINTSSNFRKINKYKIRKYLSKFGKDFIYSVFYYNLATFINFDEQQTYMENMKIIEKIVENENIITLSSLKINGNDLISQEISSGKYIGETLDYLLDEIFLNPKINEKQILLEMAKKFNQEIFNF